jgi:hypothetical protein
VDLDLAAALGPVGDRGVHDLDVLVRVVDLPNELEECLRGTVVVQEEDREGLRGLLFTHGCLLLLRTRRLSDTR